MKRKVNRVGHNTLTVSLPAKWAQKHGIRAGEEIELSEDGSRLVLSRSHKEKKIRSITINIDGFNKFLLNRFLYELYMGGIEEIAFAFSNDKIEDYRDGTQKSATDQIRSQIDKLIGLEIISASKKSVIVENLAEQEPDKIEMVQNRILFLIKQFLEEFRIALDGNFHEFHKKTYHHHDNAIKFIYYYLRLLNYSDMDDNLKMRLYSLYMAIDKILDKVRHTGDEIDRLKTVSPKLKRYIGSIFIFFTMQFEMISSSNYTLDKLDALVKSRYKIVNELKRENFSTSESNVLRECRIMLDLLNDFCHVYLLLHRDKFIQQLAPQ